MKNSCDPIEKVPIVQQISQFTKSTPLAPSHNGNHKRQYRESGFVLVRNVDLREDRSERP
tara:strand:- start:1286 stop:1465 length:180 start_codon:yes stop_codon:yes gene_type:complete